MICYIVFSSVLLHEKNVQIDGLVMTDTLRGNNLLQSNKTSNPSIRRKTDSYNEQNHSEGTDYE